MKSKEENDSLIKQLLTDPSVKYKGLYRRIDWKLYDQEYITKLIIENTEQTLMRHHLIENNYIDDFNMININKMFDAFCFTRTQTYEVLIQKFGKKFNTEKVLRIFQKRLENFKFWDSYEKLNEVELIRTNCLLSQKIDEKLGKLQKDYEKQESGRHASYRGTGLRH